MNADEETRLELRKLLLDDVALPSEAVREAMFERTFASEPGAGQDLLPPEGLFDPEPDDPTGSGAGPAGEPRADDGGPPAEHDADRASPDGGDAGTAGWPEPADPGADPAAVDQHTPGSDGQGAAPPSGDPSSAW